MTRVLCPPLPNPMILLKHTNPYGEVFYFCNLGNLWPGQDTRRLIERTSPDPGEAHVFANREDAAQTLVLAGNPPGWEIVEAK